MTDVDAAEAGAADKRQGVADEAVGCADASVSVADAGVPGVEGVALGHSTWRVCFAAARTSKVREVKGVSPASELSTESSSDDTIP